MKQLFAGIIFAAAFTCAAAWGQKGFDVVSIKPSDPLSNNMHVGISPGGSFEASGVNLMSLISQAYDVRGFQIVGGAGWMNNDKYTILTKDEAQGPSEKDLSGMSDAQRKEFRDRLLAKLQILMADRFQLKIHRDTKEMPIYALTLAKGGLKMQSSPDDGRNETSINMSRSDDAKSSVTGKRVPLESLARFLSNQVSRTVVDQTALTGKYDFRLLFSPDLGDATGPSIFTAVQEQLGLKLDSTKGPVEVLVIDSAQKPTEN
jgi:uncharacterized protein (TIGR03435 family)